MWRSHLALFQKYSEGITTRTGPPCSRDSASPCQLWANSVLARRKPSAVLGHRSSLYFARRALASARLAAGERSVREESAVDCPPMPDGEDQDGDGLVLNTADQAVVADPVAP